MSDGITIDLYEIWAKDEQKCYMSVWCETLEDAQRIAYLMDGIAHHQCTGVVRPE
jgi:hypothetical protein